MDETQGLHLTFCDEGDGMGDLTVAANFDGFSGTSAAHFGIHTLANFADRLLQYPLPQAEPVVLAGGYWAEDPDVEELEEELVALVVEPFGPRGQVVVLTRLALPREEEPPRSDTPPRHAVQVQVLTTYERLRDFSTQLTALARGERTEARLVAEVL